MPHPNDVLLSGVTFFSLSLTWEQVLKCRKSFNSHITHIIVWLPVDKNVFEQQLGPTLCMYVHGIDLISRSTVLYSRTPAGYWRCRPSHTTTRKNALFRLLISSCCWKIGQDWALITRDWLIRCTSFTCSCCRSSCNLSQMRCGDTLMQHGKHVRIRGSRSRWWTTDGGLRLRLLLSGQMMGVINCGCGRSCGVNTGGRVQFLLLN